MTRSIANYREMNTGRDETTDNVGAPNGTGVTVLKEYGNAGTLHKTVLKLTNVVIATTDNGAAGAQGSLKIYDFPLGHIAVMGCLCNLTTAKGAGGLTATAALVGSLGSVAAGAGDATLTGTEADVVASMTGTLTANAGVLRNTGSDLSAAFDGTVTALDLYLNLAAPDASSTAADTVTVNGTVTLFWGHA